jgi:hypothetical protein
MMKEEPPFREEATVKFHLNGGFTRLAINLGRYEWDIPTDKIPQHPRRLGSRFIVVMPCIRPDAPDSGDDIRAALGGMQIEELPETQP